MTAVTPAVDRFLAEKVTLVTGASRGTGVAIAGALAAIGSRIAVHYHRDREAAERVAATIRSASGEAVVVQADLTRSTDVRRLVETTETALAPIDILVNNAGPFCDTPFRDLAEAEWDAIVSTNVKAPFLLSQLVAGGMARRGWGRIVNIGATSAFVRSHSVYGLAKAALLHLTESLAVELAPAITVNAVVPSQIASARTDRMPGYKARAIAATPLGRLVTEDEIARMVALLCSPAFDFVTGRAVVMDGGRSIPVFPRLDLAAGVEP